MSSAESLEHGRGKAQLSHARAMQKLARIVESHGFSPEFIRTGVANLEKEWGNLMGKHVAYVVKTGLGFDHATHAQWAAARNIEHNNAISAAGIAVSQLVVARGDRVAVCAPLGAGGLSSEEMVAVGGIKGGE